MTYIRKFVVLVLLLIALTGTAYANVITDWDSKGVALIQGNAPAPPSRIGPVGGMRIVTVMHMAMFEAVNSIDPRYESYLGVTKPRVGGSQDAAAASAAATVLSKMDPEDAPKVKEALDAYLAGIPDGEDKAQGIKLGEETAIKVIEL